MASSEDDGFALEERPSRRPGCAATRPLRVLYDTDDKTVPELAELFSVSRATVYRVLDRHHQRPPVVPSAVR